MSSCYTHTHTHTSISTNLDVALLKCGCNEHWDSCISSNYVFLDMRPAVGLLYHMVGV